MRAMILVGSIAMSAAMAVPAQAQRVSADIIIGTGPVHGHVVIRPERPRHRHDHVVVVPRRRVVVVERDAPRVIVVERFRGRGYRSERWLRRHGYRPVVLYVHEGRYYDRPVRARHGDRDRGLREVAVWERDGRFYRLGEAHTSSYTGERYWIDDD